MRKKRGIFKRRQGNSVVRRLKKMIRQRGLQSLIEIAGPMKSVVMVETEEDLMGDLMADRMADLGLQVADPTAEQVQAEDGLMTKDVLILVGMLQVVTAEAKADQSEAGTEVSQ